VSAALRGNAANAILRRRRRLFSRLPHARSSVDPKRKPSFFHLHMTHESIHHRFTLLMRRRLKGNAPVFS